MSASAHAATTMAKRWRAELYFNSCIGRKECGLARKKQTAAMVAHRSGCEIPTDYLASSVNSALPPSALISTSWVVVPALRCAASTVYLPGGTLLMTNLPFLSVTAKHG